MRALVLLGLMAGAVGYAQNVEPKPIYSPLPANPSAEPVCSIPLREHKAPPNTDFAMKVVPRSGAIDERVVVAAKSPSCPRSSTEVPTQGRGGGRLPWFQSPRPAVPSR
jgi:hypothetical protein